jgi:hypothetical protein
MHNPAKPHKSENKRVINICQHDAVKALSDHDINVHLAQLLKLDATINKTSIILNTINQPLFDPINDDTQALRLMVQFEISRQYEAYDQMGWYYTIAEPTHQLSFLERQDFTIESQDNPDFSLNQCVCRLIVLNRCPAFLIN